MFIVHFGTVCTLVDLSFEYVQLWYMSCLYSCLSVVYRLLT